MIRVICIYSRAKEKKYWRKIKEYCCQSRNIFSIGKYFEYILCGIRRKGRRRRGVINKWGTVKRVGSDKNRSLRKHTAHCSVRPVTIALHHFYRVLCGTLTRLYTHNDVTEREENRVTTNAPNVQTWGHERVRYS